MLSFERQSIKANIFKKEAIKKTKKLKYEPNTNKYKKRFFSLNMPFLRDYFKITFKSFKPRP